MSISVPGEKMLVQLMILIILMLNISAGSLSLTVTQIQSFVFTDWPTVMEFLINTSLINIFCFTVWIVCRIFVCQVFVDFVEMSAPAQLVTRLISKIRSTPWSGQSTQCLLNFLHFLQTLHFQSIYIVPGTVSILWMVLCKLLVSKEPRVYFPNYFYYQK